MSHSEVTEAKLDILIADFQRLRESVEASQAFNTKKWEKQASLNNTIGWHTVIGSFIVLAVVSIGSWTFLEVSTIEHSMYLGQPIEHTMRMSR